MRVVKASICYKGRMAFEWSHKHYGAIALKVEDGQMNLEKKNESRHYIRSQRSMARAAEPTLCAGTKFVGSVWVKFRSNCLGRVCRLDGIK